MSKKRYIYIRPDLHDEINTGAICALSVLNGDTQDITFAFCSPSDVFNKKIARKILDGRYKAGKNVMKGVKYSGNSYQDVFRIVANSLEFIRNGDGMTSMGAFGINLPEFIHSWRFNVHTYLLLAYTVNTNNAGNDDTDKIKDNIMYKYEEEKPKLFTDEGQRMFLKIRDKTHELLNQSGAVAMIKATGGDSWMMLACVDRLVELGEIKEINYDAPAAQCRIFISR